MRCGAARTDAAGDTLQLSGACDNAGPYLKPDAHERPVFFQGEHKDAPVALLAVFA